MFRVVGGLRVFVLRVWDLGFYGLCGFVGLRVLGCKVWWFRVGVWDAIIPKPQTLNHVVVMIWA